LVSSGELGEGEVDAGDGRVAVKKVGYGRVGVVRNWWESGRYCWMSSQEGNREAASGGKSN
jgi:hypothetical protein